MAADKPTLQKIEKAPQTLRDMVQSRMRDAIISGHFAPGDRLVERPLCEQLGVSRTVIRETIRYLEAEGLVDILPNKGPIVATLNWDQAKQIYDIRRQLESSAAAAAAERQSPAFGPRLSAAVDQVGAKMSDTHWSDLLQATTRFYALIFEEAGHDIAWDVVQRLNGRISRLRALTLSTRDRAQPGIRHIHAIRDAILSGDGAAARSAVDTHISDAAQTARRFLQDDGTDPSP
ncbi:GntR family transcriptional regulator [Primorskyibacter sp. S187A]|uniref:GntR family transcriptional regulator n=1 Tax=Primorskyibacter sp. S187A TaxID=3415130 RepID=UPI003C7A9272